MNPKYTKVCSEIEKTEKKIADLQDQLSELNDKKKELEKLEIINTVRGLLCRNKQSGSSCADQLAMGLQQALMIIHGSPCPGCDTGVCVNVK